MGGPREEGEFEWGAWVTESPVINEFLCKAHHVYMACHFWEDTSFSDQGRVSFVHSQPVLWAQIPEEVQPGGLRLFLVTLSPCPSDCRAPSSLTSLRCPLSAGCVYITHPKDSFFFFLRAAPATYGSSQARNVLAAGLHHSHSNARTEQSLQPTPELTVMPDP